MVKRLTSLSDVTQQHNWESLGQRAQIRQEQLGVLTMVSRCWVVVSLDMQSRKALNG